MLHKQISRLIATLLVSALLSAASQCWPTVTHAGEDSLISFKIKDQFDRLHTEARYRGAVIVVTWGDRKGSAFMASWGPALKDTLATEIASYRLHHLEVAHVKGVPFFLKGKVKGHFTRDPTAPVLLDWDGDFDQAYDCTADLCNVLVFARDGSMTGRWAVAQLDTSILAEILATIDTQLAGARTD